MKPESLHRPIRALSQQQQLNFLLTNRIPRRLLTRFMGWYSRIESPLLTRFSLALWQLFSDELNLQEAKKQQFNSLHDCFIRELKAGVRPINMEPHIVCSPCDAIVGSCGPVEAGRVYQAKGFPYELSDLIPDKVLQQRFHNGMYVTLRLQSSMYHRFHAPVDCRVDAVNYISGDTWNVNPIALQRIEKLFCKNERAVIELKMQRPDQSIALVPVAAILVASMQFHCLDVTLDLRYRGPNRIPCSAQYSKGDEMGYFQHGSTILLFASSSYRLCDDIQSGKGINMGQALLMEKVV